MIIKKVKEWKTVYKIYLLLLLLILPIILLIVFYILPTVKTKLYDEKKEATRKTVEIVYCLIDKIQSKVGSGEMTTEQAKTEARLLIKSLRNSYKSYYWIQDVNYIMIMHPIKPELDGTNLKFNRDANGKYYSIEFTKTAREKGGGFVEYMWPKPDSKKAYPKLSYVMLYDKWGWIIGSGIYVDDVDAEVSSLQHKLVISLIIILFTVLVLAYYLSKRLSKPLFTLKKLENNSDNIYFKDLNGRFTKVSTTFAKRHKTIPEEMIGKTDFDLFQPAYAKEAFKDEQEIIKTGKPLIGKEEKESWLNGTLTWVSTSKIPLCNDSGEIIGTCGITRDITELKENERELTNILMFEKTISKISTIFLKYGAEKFETALPIVLKELGVIFQSDKSYIYYYEKGEEKFVKKEEYYLNPKETHVEFEIRTYNQWYKRLMARQTVFDFKINIDNYSGAEEKMYMRKNGLSHIVIIPIISRNLLSGFVGLECKNKSSMWLHKYESLIKILSEILSYTYSNYIAEKFRIEAEDELLTLMRAVSQSPTVIMIMNNKCKIEFVNPRFTELTGLTSTEVLGTIPSFLNPELNPKFNQESFWQFMGNSKRWEQKFQETGVSGTTFWENIAVSPIMNHQNHVTNLIAVIEDITEKMMVDSRTAISQKLESIGQLAAGIAHEINTPMQYIGDNTKFLKDTVNNLSNYLFKIQDLFNTSLEIPEQFQDKIGQLKVQYDLDYLLDELPRSIDQTELGIAKVSNLVRAMKDFAHPGIKEKAFSNINKGIEVTVEISKNEWKYVADIELNLSQELQLVYCLQDELNQVILNMIINSSHAIEEKNGKGNSQKGKIIIETFKENEFAVIKVSDTGMGIKESIINKIFDPFFTTKEVGKGTGQGLAIVHDLIVNKHNGIIIVDSTYGIGTIFIIKIPIGLNEGIKDE